MTQAITLDVEVGSTNVQVEVDSQSVAVSPDPTPTVEVEADSGSVGLQVVKPVAYVSPTATEQVLVLAVPGVQGPRGYPGTGARIYGEIPQGVQNGTNTVFTLVNQYQPRTVAVFRNGLREAMETGYTESGPAQITIASPPLPDDTIAVDYLIA